jgi:long-chain acyl-CoA synthetase
MLDLHQLAEGSRFYCLLPLSYLGGFYNQVFLPLIAGAAVVLERQFDVRVAYQFWDTIIKYQVNTLWLVPSMMSLILKSDRQVHGATYAKSGGIKHVFAGTAPLAPVLRAQFSDRYGVSVYENYGLSELLWVSTNAPTLPEIRGVGKCLDGVDVFAADAEGRRLPIGETGEIVVRSPYRLKSYFRQAQQAPDSGFSTGDIGHVDVDGYVHISGRKKDLIIKGGVNISPVEIENILSSYPGVTDVAVVGLADELYGEKIVACVSSAAAIDEVEAKAFCARHLASFKVPQRVLRVESFPRNASGKILKNQLKNDLLGQQA